jgi:hypothetical protein
VFPNNTPADMVGNSVKAKEYQCRRLGRFSWEPERQEA